MGIPVFDEERAIAMVVARAFNQVETVMVGNDELGGDTALITERLGA